MIDVQQIETVSREELDELKKRVTELEERMELLVQVEIANLEIMRELIKYAKGAEPEGEAK